MCTHASGVKDGPQRSSGVYNYTKEGVGYRDAQASTKIKGLAALFVIITYRLSPDYQGRNRS